MIRINLLPSEITEKRKMESRLVLIAMLFVIVLAGLGMFAAAMFLRVDIKTGEVETARQELEAAKCPLPITRLHGRPVARQLEAVVDKSLNKR